MDDQLLRYFSAEKNEALLFMAVGAVALAVSFQLLRTEGMFRAMMYPLAAIALIQLAVGAAVFFRTDAQVAALQSQLRESPATFKAEESQRMAAVTRNFALYKALEIALLGAGILLTYLARENALWYAVGIGLVIQSSLMLVLDLFAEHRADRYVLFVMGI